MLLEFKTSNYKCFKEEITFSLEPDMHLKDLEYSIMQKRVGNKVVHGLSSAVIYGPNAIGKSTLISAMDTFKKIVVRGNIDNVEEKSGSNSVINLEQLPNIHSSEKTPVTFSVTFVTKGNKCKYDLSIALGSFLDKSFSRFINEETLTINNKLMFKRVNQQVTISNLSTIKTLDPDFTSLNNNLGHARKNLSLNPLELFLTNGFKSLYSLKICNLVYDWISKKFQPIFHFEKGDPQKVKFGTQVEGTRYFHYPVIDSVAKEIGVASKEILVTTNNYGELEFGSLVETNKGDVIVPSEHYESRGTIRFLGMIPEVLYALENGVALIIDELDLSTHYPVIMDLVNIFHNDEINVNHAQLVFNTHNPMYLTNQLFRREEIMFIDIDENLGFITLYTLADFGTIGRRSVRKNTDYLGNYSVCRYGAIKPTELSKLVSSIINGGAYDQN